MRIAEIINSFDIGGGEVQLLELLRGLMRRHRLSVHALELRGPLLPSVRSLGFEPDGHPLGGSLASRGALRAIAELARTFRRDAVQVVHAHDFYSAFVAVPAARLAGAGVVVGRLDLGHLQSPAQRAVLAGLSHAADAVIANCGAIFDLVIGDERVPPERVSLIRNGIDLAAFDAARERPLALPLPETTGRPLAVIVANMRHEVKRQEDFLRAVSLARRERPELAAFLVGEGERVDGLKALAARLGLEGHAFFLGRRPDVPAVLARAAVGVLSSAQEGLSNAVIEGMAAGLPMVVTDAGGNGELVRDGERGLVVPVGQPEALARAIVEVISEPERARAFGQAGRRFVEREITVDRMVAEHERLYRRVAAERPGLARSVARAGGGARRVATGGLGFLRHRAAARAVGDGSARDLR
ncbi:glycosyltransferase [Anaeromyxobacter sp. Fw109-5]|uniref:glycosyltransferase n=1 Tax=Anaeromyxobacter sp. (strain Fw109-5) TaxID=404589 RepID=UPI0003142677|nr:glycosyltransferase [Anaeromyxobacter sp. Fw109-5]